MLQGSAPASRARPALVLPCAHPLRGSGALVPKGQGAGKPPTLVQPRLSVQWLSTEVGQVLGLRGSVATPPKGHFTDPCTAQ